MTFDMVEWVEGSAFLSYESELIIVGLLSYSSVIHFLMLLLTLKNQPPNAAYSG